MKPKFDKVLEQCIETGIERGFQRACKYNDAPDDESKKRWVASCILEEICEWFDFEDNYDAK